MLTGRNLAERFRLIYMLMHFSNEYIAAQIYFIFETLPGQRLAFPFSDKFFICLNCLFPLITKRSQNPIGMHARYHRL